MIPKDRLWKGILEDLFPEAVAFFYPDHVHKFDFEQVEFLDKELEQLFPDSVDSRRYADKLVKCKMKSGDSSWILLHIEVQGYRDVDFSKRMFRYYYRLYDRYGIHIAALAIFVDSHKEFRPSVFFTSCLTTHLTYQFEDYKLLDHKEEEFMESDNPFALVMLVARKALEKGKITDTRKLELKLRLYRRLILQGYSKHKISRLTTFIKYYVNFDDQSFFDKFEQQVDQIVQTQKSMGIIEVVQDEYRKMGMREAQLTIIRNWLKSAPFIQNLITYEHIAQAAEVPIEKVRQIHLEMKQA